MLHGISNLRIAAGMQNAKQLICELLTLHRGRWHTLYILFACNCSGNLVRMALTSKKGFVWVHLQRLDLTTSQQSFLCGALECSNQLMAAAMSTMGERQAENRVLIVCCTPNSCCVPKLYSNPLCFTFTITLHWHTEYLASYQDGPATVVFRISTFSYNIGTSQRSWGRYDE